MSEISMNANSFDVNLFNKLCESTDENKNIFFSPLSISLALLMLLLGSDGTTKQQLEEALGVVKDEELLYKLKTLNDVLNSNSEGLQIKLANSVFPSITFEMVAKYENDMKNAFKCQIQSLDYMKNADESKNKINDWVTRCTSGKIKDLFAEIDPGTACVLVSCIYFKGDWLEKFKSSLTKDAPFYCTKNKASTVKTMKQEKCYSYLSVDEKGFKCVRIPYKQPDFSMVIILPDERFGLKIVIEKLDVETIENIKKNVIRKNVLLEMPKFKIEYEANLNKTLRSLGIKDAFDKENAGFSAMSENALQQGRRLHVSEVVHKAFVETREEGTEAAAATGVRMRKKRLVIRPEPINFTVDHPFLFMILYYNQTLFMGKVTSL